jgi:hypothetical protein
MAADQGASEKTLDAVAKQLANVNSGISEQVSLSEQAGFHQRKAMAIAADSATELAQPVATLVRQGEAQIEAAQDAARSAAEAAREAARKGDGDGPEIAVKIEMEEESGGLFKNMKLGSLIKTFGGWIFSGLSAAFTWLSTSIGPSLLKFVKGFSPWALIITGISLAIKDGIAGMFAAEDMGVSKTAGFIGGFLGGAAKGGIANAFANAGKWALVGAGIGALLGVGIFSIPGAIIGGLLGAALGGILGYIGGEKIAKGADEVGGWFKKQFDNLIMAPIKAIWDVIAPDWIKNIDFTWDDLMPPALTKLFSGKYFTVDFPKFTWMDLFPKFLVDLFNNIKVAGKDVSFGWKDLLPKFLVKFFAGEYSKEGSFQWSDLLPEFINKIIGVATTGWEKTEFTWKSLVPNFIVKLIEGTEIKPTGTFSWKDLVPGFVWKLVDGATAAAKTDEGFIWSNLLPDWLKGAWDSTVGLAKQTYFGWKNLMPDWLQPYITTAEGGVSKALGVVGSWNWKSLLPKFIQDFITDPTQLAGDEYKFNWKDLLPEFIRNLLGDKKIDSVVKTAGLAMDWWKSLLPDFIVNIMEGKSPFADRDESTDLKKAQEAKDKLGAGMSETAAVLGLPSGEEMLAGVDWSTFDFGTWFMGSLDLNIGQKLKGMLTDVIGFAEGGIVGMGPVGEKSMASAMGLESGGLFTLSQGEFVLDNQAAQTFLQAAMILKGQDLSGMSLANLQRDKVEAGVGGTTMIVNNTSTNQVNSSQPVVLPVMSPSPASPETRMNG